MERSIVTTFISNERLVPIEGGIGQGAPSGSSISQQIFELFASREMARKCYSYSGSWNEIRLDKVSSPCLCRGNLEGSSHPLPQREADEDLDAVSERMPRKG